MEKRYLIEYTINDELKSKWQHVVAPHAQMAVDWMLNNIDDITRIRNVYEPVPDWQWSDLDR